jgi:bifunctional non-homologous end joining protein LigD
MEMRTDQEGESRGSSDQRGALVIKGVPLTHPDRVLYPDQGVTKRDLAAYYLAIDPWILPQLVDRPTTLVRCPDGVGEPCFYQRHEPMWTPEPIRRIRIQEKKKIGEYLIADTSAALIGLVQIGVLEIHTWNAVAPDLEHPDRLVFDLDPDPSVPWVRVVEAAQLLRERLAQIELASFVKTTGGKGLHVVVPIAPGPTWEECALFTRAIAEAIARADPSGFTTSPSKAQRKGKIYLDVLRNVRGATSVAAYSPRARPGAPVSMPLRWEDLGPELRPDAFTIESTPRRLASLPADPWVDYGRVGQALTEAMLRAVGARR